MSIKRAHFALLAGLLSPMAANAIPIDFFAQTLEPTIVTSFTFTANDADADGIIVASEITDFSGLTCLAGNFCSNAGDTTFDVLGIFLGNESTFNLTSLMWDTPGFAADSLAVTRSSDGFGGTFSAAFGFTASELWTVTRVPEPGTFGLLAIGLGLAGIGLARRRWLASAGYAT